MLFRNLAEIVNVALKISPVVLLSGARQVGKSTLAKKICQNYVVLDDVATRINAIENPIEFVRNIQKPICIDEIQKAPELLEAIKLIVDENRNNGDFLLTGSANVLDLKGTKDSLAGRIVELTLWPLSAKEINEKPLENCIDFLFEDNYKSTEISSTELANRIIQGGFPEIIKLDSDLEKRLWFSSYISTYIERDAREIGDIREINNFFLFMNMIAPRSATLLNNASLSIQIGLKSEMIDNFTTILEQIYQIKRIRPYFENIGKRFVKTSKMFMTDTGIMTHLLRIVTAEDLFNSMYKGQVYETFVLTELLKHKEFSNKETNIYHYRTADKKEIDFVIVQGENIVAIEVKASMNVSKSDFKHIMEFQKKSSKNIKGIIFYTGNNILDYSENGQTLVALPFGFFF